MRRFRRLNRVWAFLLGFFWLPCPICGEMFGGHEAGYVDVEVPVKSYLATEDGAVLHDFRPASQRRHIACWRHDNRWRHFTQAERATIHHLLRMGVHHEPQAEPLADECWKTFTDDAMRDVLREVS